MYNFSDYAIGGLCGPFLVGLLSDSMVSDYGSQSLRYSLMIIPIMLVPASLIYFWASLSAIAMPNAQAVETLSANDQRLLACAMECELPACSLR